MFDMIPLETLWSVTGLGLWDTLNFPVMLMLIFVLGRPHPVMHGAAFTAGLLGTHYLGGVALMLGAGSWLASAMTAVEDQTRFILLGVGIFLFALGLMMPAVPDKPKSDVFRGNHTTVGWFFIGIGLTFTKLPIAAAYGVAVGQVVRDAPNTFWMWAGLTYYNVVAYLPVFLIWGVFFLWRGTSQKFLGDLNDLIRNYAARVVKYALIIIGAGLIIRFILRFMGFDILSL